MIKNEKQYGVTKQKLEQMQRSIAKLESKSRGDDWASVEEEALRSQLSDLRSEIVEYEKLRSGKIAEIETKSFDELPTALVRARIARGMTQRDLADKLGLKEQQIQRYEQNDYAGASIGRIKEVIDALGIKVSKSLYLASNTDDMGRLFQRLNAIGLDRDFVERRLQMSPISEDSSKSDRLQAASRLASTAGRIFGWKPSELFGDIPLGFSKNVATLTRFKLPRRVSERKIAAYSVYAHYLAMVVLSAFESRPIRVEADPEKLRIDIEDAFGDVSFKSVLRFVWKLGIPVLPLRDSGLFHGACWKVRGRGVIVLKQTSSSQSRWTIDLLHELYHLIQDPENLNFGVVEAPEEATLSAYAQDEEIDATEFAGDLVLKSRADALAVMCQKEAKGKVEFLKKAVEKIAIREGVDVGALANYMAYRLALEGITNWWGTATNLQAPEDDPWSIARDMFIEYMDFSKFNPFDEELLRLALTEGG